MDSREAHIEALTAHPAATLHHVLFQIAERASAGLTLFDFLAETHRLLRPLLEARNFYVALYNPQRQSLDFPYYVDERDGDSMQSDEVPVRKGLTEYVLHTGEPQLIDAARFVALQRSGDVTEATGDLSFSAWLGVPLWIQGRVGGALVVQTYDAGGAYTVNDLELLGFVARQFGGMVERHQALQALRDSEARYRTLFEHLNVGVTVIQDEAMVFANPAMHRMLGQPSGTLSGRRFTDALHPDEVDTALQRHRRRLAGQTVEEVYQSRVVWPDGQIRHLELSAGVLPWSHGEATVVMAVDVTERTEAEASRQAALQREREMTEMKSRFIAMASHEFRTPLTSISSSLDMLTHYANRLTPADREESLAVIARSVQRMAGMVDSVLRVGSEQSTPWVFAPLAVTLGDVWRRLDLELRMDRHAAGRQLRIQGTDPEGTCVLDENLLRHIVTNLVSNALKYSPSDQPVDIHWAWQSGELSVTVQDRGIGIPEADQARLFKTYQRGSNVGSVVGVGLGLAVVQQAVTCHRGRIDWKSGPERGTRFTVVLPAPAVTQNLN